jgi:hypothetical protein
MKKSIKAAKVDIHVQPAMKGGADLMPKSEEPSEYDIDDAVRHMEKAEEIKNDPKLMPHVQKRIAEKHKTYTALKDMKKLASKKSLEEQAAHEKGESKVDEKAEDTVSKVSVG